MRRPPRPKDEPVLNTQLLYRIAFSASLIVFGTLFIYAHEFSDGTLAGRDQTMVCPPTSLNGETAADLRIHRPLQDSSFSTSFQRYRTAA